MISARRLHRARLQRKIISTAIFVHLTFALIVASPGSAFTAMFKNALICPFAYFRLYENFGVYANPVSFNELFAATVTFRDGKVKTWQFPSTSISA